MEGPPCQQIQAKGERVCLCQVPHSVFVSVRSLTLGEAKHRVDALAAWEHVLVYREAQAEQHQSSQLRESASLEAVSPASVKPVGGFGLLVFESSSCGPRHHKAEANSKR